MVIDRWYSKSCEENLHEIRTKLISINVGDKFQVVLEENPKGTTYALMNFP